MAFGMDSTQVLPRNIYSPSFRYGVFSNVTEKYDQHGELHTYGDINTLTFDAKSLAKVEPRITELVQILNQFGHDQIGDQIHLGSLRISPEVNISYFVPVLAYGVTPAWTFALAAPVVSYKNKITVSESGSNVAQIRQQFQGVSTQLDDAFNQLDRSLSAELASQLAQKGYKPLENKSGSFLGDVQLVSLWRFYEHDDFSLLLRNQAALPTGPEDDPDDLADLGPVFHETSMDNILFANYYLTPWWRLGAKTGYRFYLEKNQTVRVPLNSDDQLPDQASRQDLKKQTGDVFIGGLSQEFFFMRYWSLAFGYEQERKSADRYSGRVGSNTGLLSQDTNYQLQRYRIGVSFDSTTAFTRGQAPLPAMVNFEYSDVFAAVNTERQTLQEMTITLFF